MTKRDGVDLSRYSEHELKTVRGMIRRESRESVVALVQQLDATPRKSGRPPGRSHRAWLRKMGIAYWFEWMTEKHRKAGSNSPEIDALRQMHRDWFANQQALWDDEQHFKLWCKKIRNKAGAVRADLAEAHKAARRMDPLPLTGLGQHVFTAHYSRRTPPIGAGSQSSPNKRTIKKSRGG